MLALIFTDLHLHNYKQFDHSGSRLQYGLDCLAYMFEVADANGIKIILFGGDLYDNPGLLPTSVVNKTIDTFKKLFARYPDIEFIAITGNHDFATKNLWERPGVSALEHLDNLFERFSLIDNSHVIRGEAMIHGIPYYEYPEHYSEALKKTNFLADLHQENHKQILLIHQTPSGLGNPNIPVDTEVLDPMYQPFDRVYCGHIHFEHRDLAENFTLVGTAMHRDLSDAGQEKGFLVMNLNKPEKGYNFISTAGLFPEFKRIQVRAGKTLIHKPGDDYAVADIISESVEVSEADVTEEQFGTNLGAAELIENFWATATDGSDKDLLKTGLSFV